MTEIRFTTDKNGKRIAHSWWCHSRRWVRIGADKAEMMIAMGEAREVTQWI